MKREPTYKAKPKYSVLGGTASPPTVTSDSLASRSSSGSSVREGFIVDVKKKKKKKGGRDMGFGEDGTKVKVNFSDVVLNLEQEKA